MARDFNGSTDRIDYSSAFTTSGAALTISAWCWCDITPVTNPDYIFNSASTGGAGGTLLLLPAATGQLDFIRLGSPASLERASATGLFGLNEWVHFLATSTGSLTATTVSLYINGVEPSYLITTNGSGEFAASSGFQIGGRSSDDARNHNGRIAELAVWNRVLAAGEIAALADGFAPSFVPSGLKFYPDLINDARDRYGRAATLDGTTVIAHPPIRYRQRSKLFFLPTAAGITGTVAATEANDTLAGTGAVLVSGTAAATEDNDTLAATGAVIVSGTLAATESDDTLAATGAVLVSGTVSVTESADTLAASGLVASGPTGTVAATEADDTLLATGSVLVAGGLASTEANDTVAASGLVSGGILTGTVAATEANDTMSAIGSNGVVSHLLDWTITDAAVHRWTLSETTTT